MPKDRDTYRYIEVGLERHSWVLAKLEEDAKKHQSKQPGKLIVLRLTEYYEMKERGAHAHKGLSPVAAVSNETLPMPLPAEEHITTAHVALPQDEIIALSQHLTENADEAAEYWSAM